MKLAAMQPYLFPYLGYFQLIHLVDRFVILDDVQWITRGWINRNRLLIEGQARYFTLPVKKGAHLPINEKVFAEDIEQHKRAILRQIECNYARAPYFDSVYPLVSGILMHEEENVCRFVVHSLRQCCSFLQIGAPLVLASELEIPRHLRAQDRILAIVRAEGADHYVNLIGGMALYDRAEFEQAGVRLSFLKARGLSYPQSAGEFVADLSIIDVMMFNPLSRLKELLTEFDLL